MPLILQDRYRPHRPLVAALVGFIRRQFLAILLAFIVAAVFFNSFFGVFVFDEYTSITRNEGIKHFWPPDYILAYPNDTRPTIGLTLAINYAMHGLKYWPYHLFNLIIHVTAALTLYGIALRTFLCERLRERYGRHATWLAFAIALLWAVHPLQTASVTYVIQRCESLMGMFFFLTLYCAIRSDDSPYGKHWIAGSIVCCALGMGSKQVMVAAPLMVLLYDRTFMSGSLMLALRRRAMLYAGLLLTGGILVTSAISKPPQGHTAGFGIAAVTPYQYLLTQCAVIPYYLKLSFWPHPLCLDYFWAYATTLREVWLGFSFLSVLGLLSLVSTIRNAALGFLGAWFFAILAPSSSFMPIQDAIFEHRMYLPLAAVVAAVVLGVYEALHVIVEQRRVPRSVARTAAIVLFCYAALGLSVRTFLRNSDYYSDATIWRNTAEQYPGSWRANNNLGNALSTEATRDEAAGKHESALAKHREAIHFFEIAAVNNAAVADPHFNMAVELNTVGRKEDAVAQYKRALELNATYENCHTFMADILMELKRTEEAIEHYEAELKRDSKRTDVTEKLEKARAKLESD